MRNVVTDFNRSQTTKRITNVILLLGVLVSLAVAFPAMMGLNYALAEGTTLFFFVPLTVAFVLATLIRWLRR